MEVEMLSRQAICTMLASAAAILAPFVSHAQTTTIPPAGRTSVPIIPVSFKNDQIAATVDGEKILVGEVRRILDETPYPVTLTEEQKKEYRQKALTSLIDDALMRHYLAKHAAPVSQPEFDKEYLPLQEMAKKQNRTMEQFCKDNGQSIEELRRDVIAMVQWRTVLQRFYPEDKAKAYFDTNKVFFDKVQVRASHIFLKVPANATKEQRDQAGQKLLVWRQEIVAGKVKFADIAKQFSDCPSKADGGDIGKFRFKFDGVLPDFAKAAFAMNPGEISGVVQTSIGVHLILCVERTPPEPANFAAVKDVVREAMAKDEDLAPRILAEQRKTSEVKVNLP
jgi:parvulin-like peptidyl-prolyl isomerase